LSYYIVPLLSKSNSNYV